MTEIDPVDTLLASGIIRKDSAGRLEPGDQSGVLDAPTIERLAAVVADRVPKSTTILLTGSTAADALIAYLVGKQLGLPCAVTYDAEGIAVVRGQLPSEGGNACFVTALLEVSWQVEEFEGVCRAAGIEPLLFVALVDRLPAPDSRVDAVLRIGSK